MTHDEILPRSLASLSREIGERRLSPVEVVHCRLRMEAMVVSRLLGWAA